MSATPRRVGWIIAIAAAVSFLGGSAVVLWRWLPVWAPEWVVEHSPWLGPAMSRVLNPIPVKNNNANACFFIFLYLGLIFVAAKSNYLFQFLNETW